ncbi:hypothetical protein FB451DRAFT_1416157 [Mycena latifolia]|nr:hypothetical protein FB451DRAFT_1416157 [Mycena latifolia]
MFSMFKLCAILALAAPFASALSITAISGNVVSEGSVTITWTTASASDDPVRDARTRGGFSGRTGVYCIPDMPVDLDLKWTRHLQTYVDFKSHARATHKSSAGLEFTRLLVEKLVSNVANISTSRLHRLVYPS